MPAERVATQFSSPSQPPGRCGVADGPHQRPADPALGRAAGGAGLRVAAFAVAPGAGGPAGGWLRAAVARAALKAIPLGRCGLGEEGTLRGQGGPKVGDAGAVC